MSRPARTAALITLAAAATGAGSAAQDSPQDRPDVTQRLEAVEGELARLRAELDAERASGDLFNFGPKLTLKGFMHVNAGVERTDSEDDTQDETSNAFALGGLDLFINSQLGDGISFLGETVFEPTEEGGYVLDVERLILKYDIGDFLNVQVGRFHTTLGYWNEAFHHGEWLQTSIGRPAIHNFEDENGLLPVHLVGLVFKGTRSFDAADLDYTLEVGNGRGPTPDPPQLIVDANDGKGVNVALGTRPAAVPGLRFGGNAYFDTIPSNADANDGPVHRSMDERILGGFVTYVENPWELLVEYFNIDHCGNGLSASSAGYYVQLGRRFGDWVPYFRYDALDLDDDDTFFASVDDEDTFALGIRWDLADWNALKLQVGHTIVNGAGGGPDARITSVTLQTSFAF